MAVGNLFVFDHVDVGVGVDVVGLAQAGRVKLKD